MNEIDFSPPTDDFYKDIELGKKEPYFRFVNFPNKSENIVADAIDFTLKYCTNARWDIVTRAMEVFEAGFTNEKEPHKCYCPKENFLWGGKGCECHGV